MMTIMRMCSAILTIAYYIIVFGVYGGKFLDWGN
jgi:hypothetical protein